MLAAAPAEKHADAEFLFRHMCEFLDRFRFDYKGWPELRRQDWRKRPSPAHKSPVGHACWISECVGLFRTSNKAGRVRETGVVTMSRGNVVAGFVFAALLSASAWG